MDFQSLYAEHLVRENEIRLVHLEPSDQLDDRIIASMSVVSLDSKERYHAISYAWGSPICDDYIVCEGVRLPVTKNLHDGLTRIREKMAVRREDRIPPRWFLPTIWADAICINQSDREEKALQVQRMTTVCWKAASVIVWLGEATDDEAEDVYVSLLDHRSEADAEVHLTALVRRPWFSRRWAIQEVALNLHRHVLLGAIRFWFNLLPRKSRLMGDLTHVPFLNAFHMSDFLGIYASYFTTARDKILPPLLDNLVWFRPAACSDALDRVYALSGISREAYGSLCWPVWPKDCPRGISLDIDYIISPDQLFRTVAQHYCNQAFTGMRQIARQSALDLFIKMLIVATITAYSSESKVPSWFPDWSLSPQHRSPQHKECAEQYCSGKLTWACISKYEVAQAPNIWPPDHLNNEMQLKGWILRPRVDVSDIYVAESSTWTVEPAAEGSISGELSSVLPLRMFLERLLYLWFSGMQYLDMSLGLADSAQ